MKISPSILAANLTRLSEALSKLNSEVTDFIHLDIMDGHFVPPLTFGEQLSTAIKKETSIPLDIHLMTAQPEKEIPKYYELEPHNITFHYEAASFPIRLAQEIRSKGIKAGIALNPATPVAVLNDIYTYFDLILIMTVEPGYYGQSFLSNGMQRLSEVMNLRQRLSEKTDHLPLIEVDGGVNAENAVSLRTINVDIAVAGSFVFKAEDYNTQIEILKGNI
ncbi:MAG: ribulose-phosphate 3-epimerase [Spirochaetia bacterium]|nr:ribulose-phosphate 3-epimerase [Spirochaetia bacterium]